MSLPVHKWGFHSQIDVVVGWNTWTLSTKPCTSFKNCQWFIQPIKSCLVLTAILNPQLKGVFVDENGSRVINTCGLCVSAVDRESLGGRRTGTRQIPSQNKQNSFARSIFVFLENEENLRFIRAKTRRGEQTYAEWRSSNLRIAKIDSTLHI